MTETSASHMRRYILILVMIAVLAALIMFSARSGLSYIAQYRLHAAIDSWIKNSDQKPLLNEWQEMQSMAADALAADTSNPDLHNGLGRLHEYRASSMALSKQESLQQMQHAIQHYRQVILLRPAWPYGYLNLVSSKARIGALDTEFSQSLLQLVKRAPWERNTLPAIVEYSTYAWPHLQKGTRTQLQPYLLQAAEKRTKDVKKSLQQTNLLNFFCSIIARKETDLTLCR